MMWEAIILGSALCLAAMMYYVASAPWMDDYWRDDDAGEE